MSSAAYNTTNWSRSDLEDLNDARAEELVPAMVVLCLFMLVGTVGNLLVCYIFGFKLKHSVQNLLVVCLAVFDLLSCLISIPGDIVDLRFFYKYPSEPACKVIRFITTLASTSSCLTLIVIALDRYRKICQPTKRQMEVSHFKVCLGLIFFGASFFSWPAPVIFGMRSFDSGIPGLEAKDCSTSDKIKDTIYPMVYLSILFIVFIFLCVTLTIVYCRVLVVRKRCSRSSMVRSLEIPTSLVAERGKRCLSHDKTSGESNKEDFLVYKEPHVPEADQDRDTSTSSLTHSEQSRQPHASSMNAPTDNGGMRTSRQFDEGANNFNTRIAPEAHHDKETSQSKTKRRSNILKQLSLNHREREIVDSQDATLIRLTPLQQHNKDRANIDVANSTETEKDVPESSTQKGMGTADNKCKSTSIRRLKQNRSNSPTVLRRSQSLQTSQSERKTTIIAFLVTLVFILSFLPYLCLQLSKQIKEGYDTRLEGAALVAFNIFLRSYYFNSVSNPFIYGVLNFQFRHEFRSLFSNLFFQKCTRQ